MLGFPFAQFVTGQALGGKRTVEPVLGDAELLLLGVREVEDLVLGGRLDRERFGMVEVHECVVELGEAGDHAFCQEVGMDCINARCNTRKLL
ncbi:hypothetical protein [Streptomyces lydicus]|uniref:hypothetical protein n=1 Tax=Streptomyces lydicus TaxID=47763 RepID=UPI0010104C78|nr:hypothetical protein [Streptomyces lydicus]MCZ1012326.1 hypothetical protein [Streptomyces lydicus]